MSHELAPLQGLATGGRAGDLVDGACQVMGGASAVLEGQATGAGVGTVLTLHAMRWKVALMVR